MAIIISGITLPFTKPPELAVDMAIKMIGNVEYKKAFIVKKSVDARHKEKINFVYSVAVEIDGNEEQLVNNLSNPKITAKKPAKLEVFHGTRKLENRPVIAGFGPAGMFAGLLLARQGYRPIIIERGNDVDARIADVESFWLTGKLNTESNVQYGEGGAGTFSDGKLTTRIGDPLCGFVLKELAAHGAPEEILWNAKPHVGTDRLRKIVKSIREEIITLGGDVRFNEKLTDISFDSNDNVKSISTSSAKYSTNILLLALGHSARDTFSMLFKNNVYLESKPFSVGVRIEHLQSDIDKMLYGSNAGNPLLPRGEYQLSYKENGRAVYTFCMCPGGVVVAAASQDGMVVTNGMSCYARNENNANSALVVSVDKKDFGENPLGGIEFQECLEQGAFLAGKGNFVAPAQTVDNFLAGKTGYSLGRIQPSYSRGVHGGDFSKIFPEPVIAMLKTGLSNFERKLKGFAAKDILLTGIESRTSSPVRILRNENMQSVNHCGLYPCGEGAGYAGGIVSAAVDGIRVAQAIINEFSPD